MKILYLTEVVLRVTMLVKITHTHVSEIGIEFLICRRGNRLIS